MYIEPKISLNPHKIVLYNRVLEDDGSPFRKRNSILPTNNSHKGVISSQASNRLKEKINWLVYKSKKQKVVYPNGNISHNFRISFITLTLPTKQLHSDIEIKRILNNFLTILRKRYQMKDYVWKAELQANKNIHFHITTNVYLDYNVIRTIWNNCINTLGYIDSYQKKFSTMSFNAYKKIRRRNAGKSGISDEAILKSFNFGKKTNWTAPNSTDVKTVFKVENLQAYMAKYLSKKVSKSKLSKDRVNNFGSIWSCSRSLSKLVSYSSLFCNKFHDFVCSISQVAGVRCFFYDYCTVFYFDIQKIPKGLAKVLNRLLYKYMLSVSV